MKTLLVLLIGIVSLYSQDKLGNKLREALNSSSEENFVIWIYFTDKGPEASDKLNHPLSLVTQRSLDRRSKVKLPNKLVDYTDVPVYELYVNDIADRVIKVRTRIKWLNCVSAEVSRHFLNSIAQLKFVKGIELVEKFKLKKDFDSRTASDVPDVFIRDSYNPFLPDSFNYGTGNAVTQITQIKVNLVHNQGIMGQGILIANFDAGFSNLTHEVFTTYPMKIIRTYDFHNNTPNLTGHSHGTATLSLVGGYRPTKMIGPAFASSFILARTEVATFERPIEMDYWIAAAQWADSLGADIITSSLGYLEFDPGYTSYTWMDMNGNTLPITIAADLAVNKGIIVSNSAGNNGLNTTRNTLIGPADGDSVLTVGAVTTSGVRASFSSVGPTTDVPPRIKPDVMAMGSSNYYASTTGNNYTSGSGTSFSCPLVSGVCALMLSANKSLTPMQVIGILRKFGSNSSSPNNQMGWGIVDASLSVDSARKLDNIPPTILHTQPFTNTSNNGPITMMARIYDNGIIRNWVNEAPLLYFRKSTDGGSSWSAFQAVNYSTVNGDTFSFVIPGSSNGTTVQYYFAAQDIALPIPRMSTLPSGGSGINPPGSVPPSNRFQFTVGTVGIVKGSDEIPVAYRLYANYPNPFNPATRIKFDLPLLTNVSIKIFDLRGRFIAEITEKNLDAGRYEFIFDGSSVSSGVYFYRLEADNFSDTKKMILLK
ncbi:MAG: S8 family peptidase [Ignavibacteria bacterium]|nr:S8 family peptidase [Ignavibacteria bacterium]